MAACIQTLNGRIDMLEKLVDFLLMGAMKGYYFENSYEQPFAADAKEYKIELLKMLEAREHAKSKPDNN